MTQQLITFILAGLFLGTPAFAQEQPSRTNQTDDSARDRGFRRRWEGRRWDEASAFFQEYSPRRWAAYESLPETQQGRIRTAMIRRYSHLERIREHSPDDVYEMVLRRVELEDEAWGLGQDIREAVNPAARDALRAELQEVVQLMVEEQFLERERRIERLKKALANEEKRLEEDRQNVDALVQRQMERIIATDHPLADPTDADNPPPATSPSAEQNSPRDREAPAASPAGSGG